MSNVVVVGANRGIGLALCAKLVERGDSVVATCRTTTPELRALGVEIVEGIDVTSAPSVEKLARHLERVSVDLLVVVAGLLGHESLEALDFERVQAQLEVNAVGPLRVVAALQRCLHQGSKVVLLTSRMGSIADNSSGGYYGYRMSKAALNMAGRSLALDLAPRGVAVALMHPGYVRTDMTGGQGQISPEESAAMLVDRIDELSLATTSTFVHANGEKLPW